MISTEIPEGYDPNSLLARFEWQHIQTSARRHASARDTRIMVIGERSEGGTGWHYVIVPAMSQRAIDHSVSVEFRLLGDQARRDAAQAVERALP